MALAFSGLKLFGDLFSIVPYGNPRLPVLTTAINSVCMHTEANVYLSVRLSLKTILFIMDLFTFFFFLSLYFPI